MVICLVGGQRLHLENAPPIIKVPKPFYRSYRVWAEVARMKGADCAVEVEYNTWIKDGQTWDSAWGCLVWVYRRYIPISESDVRWIIDTVRQW